MFEDLGIDLEALRVRHAPDILGVFEPVSCLIFLNVTEAELIAAVSGDGGAETLPLSETIDHEMCHYFQTFCTGYLYRQYNHIRELYLSSLKSYALGVLRGPDFRRFAAGRLRRAARFWMPPPEQARRDTIDGFRRQLEMIARFERRSAESGERTISGASMPGLHAAIEAVRAESLRKGNNGLSPQDVYEGAAFVMSIVTEHGAQAEDDLRSRLSNPENPYERLMDVSQRLAPQRPVCSALLMAAALALRYDHPGEAYLPLLTALLAESPGHERARAKMMARSLPVIPEAGPVLGTGRAVSRTVWRKREDPTDYAAPMRKLSDGTWPIDELDLLTDPHALGAIPLGELTVGIVTRDAQWSAPGTRESLKARMLFGSDLLPNGPSVANLRKRFQAELLDLGPLPFLAQIARKNQLG